MAITINGTTGISGVDGSAATPALQGADTNTGISFGTDTVTINTGGVARVTTDASGNVGIGTSSPSSIAGYTNLTINNATNGGGLTLQNNGTNAFSAAVDGSNVYLESPSTRPIRIFTNGSERMRIDSSGNLLVGTTTSPTQGRLYVGATTGGYYSNFGNDHFFNACTGGGASAASTGYIVQRITATGRSINAAGTVNASGADYAEYMTKCADFTVAKGDVVGINAQGKLTNVFDHAITFVVKSTSPSYVGGDTWGSDDAIGVRPSPDAPEEEIAAFEAALEVARNKVDRIAFAGQVPVNVFGSTPGQYIIPVNDNGSIKGQAVSNPTFEQYQIAVGKVIAIEQDGRAKIIVKVV